MATFEEEVAKIHRRRLVQFVIKKFLVAAGLVALFVVLRK